MLEGDKEDKGEINKDLLGLNAKDKYNTITNLISANEHDNTLKTIFVHEQAKVESKSFRGFDMMEKITKESMKKESMENRRKIGCF